VVRGITLQSIHRQIHQLWLAVYCVCQFFFPISGLNVLIAIGWHAASGYPPMLRLRNIAEGVKRDVNGTSYLENGVMNNMEING